MKKQAKTSKTDTIVKLVLIFFISLLSFTVGTFVGKQVSDMEHRRADLEGEYNQFRGVASVENEEPNIKVTKNSRLSEEEITSLTEEFMEEERKKKAKETGQTQERKLASENSENSNAKGTNYKKYERTLMKEMGSPTSTKVISANTNTKKVSQTQKVTKSATKTVTKTVTKTATTRSKTAATTLAAHSSAGDTTSKVAQAVSEGKAPTKDSSNNRRPSSIPKNFPDVASSAIGKYTIQLASYPKEEEAKTHAAQLKEKGFSAFYIPASIKGKTWFRVSVGLFSNHKRAQEFQKNLVDDGKISSSYVQKIVK